MPTDFLNGVHEDNFVFIKTMPKTDEEGETKLYFKKKKDIPEVNNFTFASECTNGGESNTLLKVFTVDKGKYDQACKSATKPLNIDEVAGENKACYTVDNTVFGSLIEQFPETNSIVIGKSSLNIKFDGDNRVTEVTIKNLSADNEAQKVQSQEPGTDSIDPNQQIDGTPQNKLQAGQDNTEEHVPNYTTIIDTIQSIIDQSHEQSGVNKKLLNIVKLVGEKDNGKEFTDENATYDKIKEIMDVSDKSPKDKYDEIKAYLNNTMLSLGVGGKATRRRKRKGKKRSKNTRKKRKSKKARKSKR